MRIFLGLRHAQLGATGVRHHLAQDVLERLRGKNRRHEVVELRRCIASSRPPPPGGPRARAQSRRNPFPKSRREFRARGQPKSKQSSPSPSCISDDHISDANLVVVLRSWAQCSLRAARGPNPRWPGIPPGHALRPVRPIAGRQERSIRASCRGDGSSRDCRVVRVSHCSSNSRHILESCAIAEQAPVFSNPAGDADQRHRSSGHKRRVVTDKVDPVDADEPRP